MIDHCDFCIKGTVTYLYEQEIKSPPTPTKTNTPPFSSKLNAKITITENNIVKQRYANKFFKNTTIIPELFKISQLTRSSLATKHEVGSLPKRWKL